MGAWQDAIPEVASEQLKKIVTGLSLQPVRSACPVMIGGVASIQRLSPLRFTLPALSVAL